jgi:hypothetical protein
MVGPSAARDISVAGVVVQVVPLQAQGTLARGLVVHAVGD